MTTPSSYDHVPYPAHAYKETHPDHLAAIARLHGLTTRNVKNCRVLEIGCGDGSNLIPMAVSLPESEFIGVELARQPVEAAAKTIEACGLKNVKVHRLDLMDITEDFGIFDYILAHGVYSWIPKNVRERLLQICNQNLSPNGVAFVSYNTFPAGHLRQACREMMRFHLGQEFDAVTNVNQGKAFLKMMTEAVERESLWNSMVKSELERYNKRDDHVSYHDEFSTAYTPFYFSDFVRDAQAVGLQFVSETKTKDALHASVNPNALQSAQKLAGGDQIRFEQYLDFFSFNGFRGSLLAKINRSPEWRSPAKNLVYLGLASPLVKVKMLKDGSVEFKNRRGPGIITTNDSSLISALQLLEEKWPQSVQYDVLVDLALLQPSYTADIFAKGILELTGNSLVDLRSQSLFLPDTVSTTPTASPLVRLQAAHGKLLTTLLHSHVEISDGPVRRVLQLLDGTRDISNLVRHFSGDYPASSRTAIEVQLTTMLESFLRMGLLIG